MTRQLILAACAMIPLAFAAPARAQDATSDPADFTVTGEVSLTSDYRFRGISYTNLKAAVQPSLTVSHESGVYANLFASSLPETPLLGKLELDYTLGWVHAVGDHGTIDVGGGYYTYPTRDLRATDTDFGELYVRYSRVFGPVTATAMAAYAPSQSSLYDNDSLYVAADVLVAPAKAPVSFTAHLGRTDGSLAPNGAYADWSVGALVAAGRLRFGLSYVDTDIPTTRQARAGVVACVKLVF